MRTVSRVYDSYENASAVVQELESAGIDSSDISFVASRSALGSYPNSEESSTADGAGLGAAIGGSLGLLAGLGVMAVPGLGPIVAAGWLASTAAGAAAGAATGGLLGALIDNGEDEDTAHVYSEAVRRGGSLISVRAENDHAVRVEEIMDGLNPIDPSERRSQYRERGWTGFDPMGLPYAPIEPDVRNRHRSD